MEYGQRGELQVTSWALFGQATFHASDRLALTAGLRYTNEKKAASNTGTVSGGALLPDELMAARLGVINSYGGLFTVADEQTNKSWSWLINPSFKVTEDVLLYASVSYGEKSGAANLSATVGRPLIIDPEKATAYEAGIKSSFANGRARLSANLYWNDISDFQATQIDPTRLALGTFLGNAAQVRLRGVELEGGGRLGGGLNLSFSGSFNDAKYRSYANAPVPVEYGYAGGPTSMDLSGTRIPGSSRWSGQVSLDYDTPISNRVALIAYANQSYRSSTNFLNPISDYGTQEGYGLTNAGIGIKSADGRRSLTLWGRNIFDKVYAVRISSATPVSPFLMVLGDPRTYGLTAKASF